MADDLATLDLARFREWIGRRRTVRDTIDPARAAMLAALLDRDDPEPAVGDPLPPCWHWVYFPEAVRRSDLGPDGHLKRGNFFPPVPLPRRMWAGGRIRIDAPIRIGDAARRESTVTDVHAKTGASGRLVFVTARHEMSTGRGLAVTEEQDIAYVETRRTREGTGHPPGKPAPGEAAWTRGVTPDPVLLFRYSALTHNPHRIHYDHPFATGVEGYAGLVVHGPLIATLLVELLRSEMPDTRVASFRFRAVAPLFDTAPFTVNGKPAANGASVDLWAARPDGGLAMQAVAVLAA